MKREIKNSKKEGLGKDVLPINVQPRTYDVRFRTDDLRFRTDDVRVRTDHVRVCTDDVRFRMDDVRFRKDHVRVCTDDLRNRRFMLSESPVSRLWNSISEKKAMIILMASVSDGDFIPGGNGEFDSWQKNLVIKVNSFIGGWSIGTAGTAEWATLTGVANVKQIRWGNAWTIVSSKQFTHSQEVEMIAARKSYESGNKENPLDTSLRLFITRYVRNNVLVTDEQKSKCGLTVPKGHATPTNPDTVEAVKEAVMVVSIKESKHLTHILKITQDKKSVAKGKDVLENSIYLALTAGSVMVAPDISAFAYDGAVSRGLYTRTFDPSLEGQRAWYITRKKYKGKSKKIGTPSVAASGLII